MPTKSRIFPLVRFPSCPFTQLIWPFYPLTMTTWIAHPFYTNNCTCVMCRSSIEDTSTQRIQGAFVVWFLSGDNAKIFRAYLLSANFPTQTWMYNFHFVIHCSLDLFLQYLKSMIAKSFHSTFQIWLPNFWKSERKFASHCINVPLEHAVSFNIHVNHCWYTCMYIYVCIVRFCFYLHES